MAPIFQYNENKIQVKPLIQLIFENLYDVGIREFCFVTGKTKRSIENHFTPDVSSPVKSMNLFYEKLRSQSLKTRFRAFVLLSTLSPQQQIHNKT